MSSSSEPAFSVSGASKRKRSQHSSLELAHPTSSVMETGSGDDSVLLRPTFRPPPRLEPEVVVVTISHGPVLHRLVVNLLLFFTSTVTSTSF